MYLHPALHDWNLYTKKVAPVTHNSYNEKE